MPLELVPEEEMETKSKRKDKKRADLVITKTSLDVEKEKKLSIIPEEGEKEEKIEKKENINVSDKEIEKNVDIEKKIIPPASPNVIVKRIYFPGNIYSKKENQNEFKKMLANYGFSWNRYMMKTYISREGVKILTGMYSSADKNKKIFCIYEGTDKPTTAILKIIGTGGNFLIDILSFAHRIGCIVEDKDENFVNNTMLTLKEKGEIYVEKILEEKKIENYEKILEEKFQKYIENLLKEYIEANKEFLTINDVSIKTFEFFKRKEIEENARWALEHGFLKL